MAESHKLLEESPDSRTEGVSRSPAAGGAKWEIVCLRADKTVRATVTSRVAPGETIKLLDAPPTAGRQSSLLQLAIFTALDLFPASASADPVIKFQAIDKSSLFKQNPAYEFYSFWESYRS